MGKEDQEGKQWQVDSLAPLLLPIFPLQEGKSYPLCTHTHPTTTTTTSPDHLPGKGKASQQNFPCHLSCPVLVSACPCCDWYGLVGFSAFLHGTCHCHSPTWVEHLLPNRGSNQRSDRLHKEKSPLFYTLQGLEGEKQAHTVAGLWPGHVSGCPTLAGQEAPGLM